MGHEVRTRITPATWQQVAGALARAWPVALGEPATDGALRCLVANFAVECGWAGPGIHNYNLGNVMLGGSTGNWSVWASAGQKFTRKWRAFLSLDEGAAGWIAFLARNYPEAMAAARRGDGRAYVRALQAKGYAEEGPAYSRLFDAVFKTASARLPDGSAARILAGGAPWSPPPPPIADEPVTPGRGARPSSPPVTAASMDGGSLAPLGLGVLALLARVGENEQPPPVARPSWGESLALGASVAALFGFVSIVRAVRGLQA